MKVYLLLIGYDSSLVRAFATKAARDKAADEYKNTPLGFEDDVEVEGDPAEQKANDIAWSIQYEINDEHRDALKAEIVAALRAFGPVGVTDVK